VSIKLISPWGFSPSQTPAKQIIVINTILFIQLQIDREMHRGLWEGGMRVGEWGGDGEGGDDPVLILFTDNKARNQPAGTQADRQGTNGVDL
jgi:hypothetical protein